MGRVHVPNKGFNPRTEGSRPGAMSERDSVAISPYSNPYRRCFEKESFAIVSTTDRHMHTGGSKMVAEGPETSTFVHFFGKAHARLWPLVLLGKAVIKHVHRKKGRQGTFSAFALYLRLNLEDLDNFRASKNVHFCRPHGKAGTCPGYLSRRKDVRKTRSIPLELGKRLSWGDRPLTPSNCSYAERREAT